MHVSCSSHLPSLLSTNTDPQQTLAWLEHCLHFPGWAPYSVQQGGGRCPLPWVPRAQLDHVSHLEYTIRTEPGEGSGLSTVATGDHEQVLALDL